MSHPRSHIRDMILCALFTALIAAGAFIRVPVPVIPFTLQFTFTNLAGLLLGGKRGAVSTAVYVALGLAGLPVFTAGGGIGYIFQPTFGYLIGFIAGAWITGTIAGKAFCPSARRLAAASFLGLSVVYLFGMVYYWIISTFYLGTGIGLWPLFLQGFLMTAPGDIALCFLSVILGRRLIPVLRTQLGLTA